jgi:hypothetical protein
MTRMGLCGSARVRAHVTGARECVLSLAAKCAALCSGAAAAVQEKEDSKKMKQKQRDRMAPKMGKMDIDYQVGSG